MKDISIIGLVGPSGVGKGYCKEIIKSLDSANFKEPVVVTTRKRRPTDGLDRKTGLTTDELLQLTQNGKVLFPHQPFGIDGDWYGFDADSLQQPGNYLTEVHPDNVIPFHEKFSHCLLLIGLVADQDYLLNNLNSRGTESDSEKNRRLAVSMSEIDQIYNYHENGLIHTIISINPENRVNLGVILSPLVHGFISGDLFK